MATGPLKQNLYSKSELDEFIYILFQVKIQEVKNIMFDGE